MPKIKLLEYDPTIFAGDAMDPAIQFRDQTGAVSGSIPRAKKDLEDSRRDEIDRRITDMFDYARPLALTLKDYFNTGDDVNPGGTDTDWLGFTFTAGSTYTLSRLRLKLRRPSGSEAGAYIRVRNASGNYPVGGDLAYASLPYTVILTGEGSWHDIDLSASVSITSGNKYTIIIHSNGPPDHIVGWRADNDPGASYGVSICSDDSGASWFLGTVYGQGANLAYMYECWGY